MTHVVVIAEAGVNHNGDFDRAVEMIKVAKEAGADYVKFQSFIAEQLVAQNASMAEYQKRNLGTNESQLDMLKKLEMGQSEQIKLLNKCRELGIGFMSSPFDLQSLDFLATLNLDFIKIPSGEITNYLYLKKAAKLFKKIVLSTGMSTISEIRSAIQLIESQGILKSEMTLLHCSSEYPTPMKHVNLKAMNLLEQEFHTQVGYSDHTLGVEIPVAAVSLGATVIEKHFTLDKNLPGPDHKASLDPSELKDMIKKIRNIELALGTSEKKPSEEENKTAKLVRKSLFLVKDFKRGQVIDENCLMAKRPGDGISAMEVPGVVGKKLKNDLSAGHLLSWEDLE